MTERTDDGQEDRNGRNGRNSHNGVSGKSRRRGVPKPEWGDNVIEADFGSRARREDASTPSTSRSLIPAPIPGNGPTPTSTPTPTIGDSAHPTRRSARTRQHTSPSGIGAGVPSLNDAWVGRQILDAVSATTDTARRSRGREYFRAGKVQNLDLDSGTVNSLVAGSQLEPFEVSLQWRTLTANQAAYIRSECLEHPENLSQLLAGREPCQDVAAVLCRPGDFQESWCTCPDRSGMCKHRVAVTYALVEKFTADPIAFLDWRGLDAQQLIAELDARASASVAAADNEAGGSRGEGSEALREEEQRYSSQEFWGDLDRLPRWDSLDVERGLDLGDLEARNAVIRKVSWNTVDQLRVLDELQSCYDLLTGDAVAPSDNPFASEPWLSRQDDRISDHD